MKTPLIAAACCASALFLQGCSAGDEDNASASDENVDVSASAAQSLDVVDDAITYALTASGESVQAVAWQPSLIGGLASTTATLPGRWIYRVSDISFRDPQDVDQLIDLDDLDENGADRFPNASGLIRVQATVDSSGAPGDGSGGGTVSYDPIVVSYESSVVVTNPDSGTTVSWPQGTTMSGDTSLVWSRTDALNWSYSITSHKQANKSVSIDNGSHVAVGQVSAEWTGSRSRSRTAGERSAERSLTGTRSVTWTIDGGASHQVLWDVRSLDEIYLSIDGETRGPYSFWQWRRREGTAPFAVD